MRSRVELLDLTLLEEKISRLHTVRQNVLALFGVRAVQSFSGWLLTVMIARYLGPEEYGGYAFAFAFAGLFVILSDVGLNSFLIRELSAATPGSPCTLSAALVIKPILAFVAFAAIAISINLLHYSALIRTLVYLLGAQTVIRSLSGLFIALIHAAQEMHFDTKAESLGRLSGVSLGFVALLTGLGLAGVASGLLVGELIRLLYLLRVTRGRLQFRRSGPGCGSYRSVLISALPFGLFSLMMSLNYKADTVVLSFFLGQTAVGIYSAAYHLVLASLLIPAVIAGALYPSFSSIAAVEPSDKLAFPLTAASKLLLILGVGTSIVIFTWAREITELLYTSSYAQSVPCLRILSWSVALMFPQYVLGASMLAIRKEKAQLAIWIAAVGLNLLFNVIFIPKYGVIAASVVTVFTEALLLLLFWAVMRSELKKPVMGREAWRLVVPLVLTFVCGSALARFSVSMPFGILLTGVILLLSVVTFRAFSSDEIALYKRLRSMGTGGPQ